MHVKGEIQITVTGPQEAQAMESHPSFLFK